MENTYFKLSRNKLKGLLFYFGILLLIGLLATIFAINYESFTYKFNITQISLIGGFGTALIGSTIFYMRKLYKSAINNTITEPTTDKEKTNETGLFFYYSLRPIFAIAFSLLIHIGLKASVAIITVKESELDVGMVYLTMIISFFIGFAAGDVITKLEEISKEIAKKSIDKIS